MEEAISFFRAVEPWIYAVLALGGLYYLRKFILAWRELHIAAFGLERESAQSRLNQSASMLVFILLLAILEFVLVTFIGPSLPASSVLPTPTLDLLASPTTTLSLESTQTSASSIPTAAFSEVPVENNCVAGQIFISSPMEGDIVNEVVEINGTANIPNFGFYTLQMKRPDESIWATIQAGNQVKIDEKLGDWDTRRLTPGVYQIGLVLVDNEAKTSEPCVVQVNVTITPEETSSP